MRLLRVGPLGQERLQRRQYRLGAEQRRQQRVRALGAERIDSNLGVAGLAAPGVAIFGSIVDQQQDPGGRQALHQAVEQRLGLAVDPVQVLEDQQQRLDLALEQQEPLERVERLAAPLAGIE